WKLQAIKTPRPNTGAAELNAVSCPAAKLCVAAGGYSRDAILTHVAEIWNGKKWVVQDTSISSPNDSSVLNGASCTSQSTCMTVGSFHNSFFNQDHTLALRLAVVWQQSFMPTPTGSTGTKVEGVSCPTTTMCAAVGVNQTSGGIPQAVA